MKKEILNKSKKLKILISAYACEPNKGSEPGVGWYFVTQIAKEHKVWVITRANNQKTIEAELQVNPQPNVTCIFYDLPDWAKFWKRGNKGIHLYYYLWQVAVGKFARKLSRQVEFDLSHHLTFVMYWLPSFLWLTGKPFVWGPVGGGELPPNAFWGTFSLKGQIHEYFRLFMQRFFEKDFFVKKTAKNASITLSTTEDTRARLKKIGCKKTTLFSQVALTKAEIDNLKHIQIFSHDVFRFMSVGNLLHLKGFHLSISAFISFNKKFPKSEYWIIGNGPELSHLKSMAKESGLEGRIHFKGKLPRNEVLKNYSLADVFIQPSLHDSGGFVSVEAMAAGLPVICLDLGGPALQVTEETGFKIPAISPQQVIDAMAEAMLKLAQNPELRKQMGAAGRKRVEEHFNWDKKGEFINQIYREVLANQ